MCAVWKELKLSSDDGISGSKKCKQGYGGTSGGCHNNFKLSRVVTFQQECWKFTTQFKVFMRWLQLCIPHCYLLVIVCVIYILLSLMLHTFHRTLLGSLSS
jgi:hypothetical protein